MNFLEIADYIWKNSAEISFGNTNSWNPDLFTVNGNHERIPSRPGWYWFLIQKSYQDLAMIPRPRRLPSNGCNISSMTQYNQLLFSMDLLVAPDNEKFLVIYNGHEKKVSNRIRSHYSLNNNLTGALGIIHYPLSTAQWKVKYFTEENFSGNINGADKDQILGLMNSATGRCSIESAWRAKYGWPVLCKQ